jgi:hypothetical protein
MDTQVRSIDLAGQDVDVAALIVGQCNLMGLADYKLAGTFTFGVVLYLVFQRF